MLPFAIRLYAAILLSQWAFSAYAMNSQTTSRISSGYYRLISQAGNERHVQLEKDDSTGLFSLWFVEGEGIKRHLSEQYSRQFALREIKQEVVRTMPHGVSEKEKGFFFDIVRVSGSKVGIRNRRKNNKVPIYLHAIDDKLYWQRTRTLDDNQLFDLLPPK